MKLPFELKSPITLLDVQILSCQMLLVMMKYALFFFCILSLFNVYTAIKTGQEVSTILSSFIGLLVMMTIIIIIGLVTGTRLYYKKKEQFESIHYTFTDNSIHIHAIDLELRLAWSNFSRAKENPRYILLYQGKIPTQIIPKRYFKEKEACQELVTFLKEKI